MSNYITPPYPIFTDVTGTPLDAGFVFIGAEDSDAIANPINVYWDKEKTQLADQPLRTRNGYISKDGSPCKIFIDQPSCSIFVKNRFNTAVLNDLSFDILSNSSAVVAAVGAERERAIGVEAVLDQKIESTNTTLDSKITNESSRAQAAEDSLLIQLNAVGVGNNAYKTYALMDADKANIPAKSKVTVTNDATASNNGDWQWDGAVFTKSEYDPITQSKNYTLNELSKYLEIFNLKSGWALAFKDAAQQVLFGTDVDGKFNAQGIYVVDELIKTISRLSDLEDIVVITPNPARSGVIFALVDSINQMLMHLDRDFKLYVAGIEVGIDAEMKTKIETLYSLMFPIDTFVALGDSLTEGAGSSDGKTYPYYLAQTTGRNVSNQGIGGQDATRISARLNGTTVLVTLPNNQIPADTSPVAVTLSIPLLTTPATTAARTRKVIINGISGTLSKDTSNSYTFARDVVGTVVNVAPNTAMIIDTGDLQKRIALLWMGTNNSFATEADRKVIIDHIDAAIAALKPIDKRYLVLSPWKPASNIKGSDTHNQMLEMHKLLAAKYKDRFVNVWWDLVCSYDPNIPQDVIDFNNMVIPSSLWATPSDSTHLGNNGYQIIGSQSIPQKITQLGW